LSDRIQQELTEIFHNVFADDSIVLTRDLTASQVDGWDSLAHVRLLLTAERKFGIRINAAEAGKLKNVGDLLDLLHAKVGPHGG
jgi:acyl carrier protein